MVQEKEAGGRVLRGHRASNSQQEENINSNEKERNKGPQGDECKDQDTLR